MPDDKTQLSRPRMIWLNIDGLNAEPLYEALDAGELPNLGKVFGESFRVERAASAFPTSTIPCQASLATGCYPSKHGLVGNSWFDRFSKQPKYRNYNDSAPGLTFYGRKYFKAPSVVLPPRTGPAPANTDLSGSARTVYEEVSLHYARSAVMFNQINRGARDWIRPGRMEIAQFALCHDGHLEFSHYERAAMKRTVAHLNRIRKLPRLFMAYLPGMDGHTHRYGPKAQGGYLKTVIDPLLGMLFESLGERRQLKDFTFVLTSDHGHAAVTPDKAHRISADDVGAILREHGRTPFIGHQGQGLRSFDTILMPHGGSMHISVKNRITRRWYDLPELKTDLFPLALAFMDAAKSERFNVAPGWLDIALVKDHISHRYLVVRDHKVYTVEKFFAAPAHVEKYPDGARRVRGLYNRYSPDLVLLSNYDNGFHFSPNHTRSGMHGNLAAGDSVVPILFSGPNIAARRVAEGSIVDVAPTICSMFGATLHSAEGNVLDVYSKRVY